jgi:hypothetical protein
VWAFALAIASATDIKAGRRSFVIIGRNEALDLFRKWLAEGSLIRCQGSFPIFAFSFRSKVVGVSSGEVRLMSADTNTEFAWRMTNGIRFDYADSRTVTGQEAIDYECCLVVIFGEVPDEGDADSLAFAEIRISN